MNTNNDTARKEKPTTKEKEVTVQDASSKAKAALDKIKITKEKGEGKDAPEKYKMENNPVELQAALDEAKSCIDNYHYNQEAPKVVNTQEARYSIDKIALVRDNPDHVRAAVEDAKKALDKLAEQDK
jgi:hypothetical protein